MGRPRKNSSSSTVGKNHEQKMSKLNFESQLINFVRERPQLYCVQSAGYHDAIVIENTWQECAEKFSMQVDEIKICWKNLKGQYLAYRRKLKTPTGSGAGNQPRFRHEKSMDFLKDDMRKPLSTISNFPATTQITENDDENENLNTILTVEGDDIDDAMGPVNNPVSEATPSMALLAKEANDRKRKREKQIGKNANVVEQEFLGAIHKVVATTEKEKSEEELFLESLLPKLRRINSVDPGKFGEIQIKFYQTLIQTELEIRKEAQQTVYVLTDSSDSSFST